VVVVPLGVTADANGEGERRGEVRKWVTTREPRIAHALPARMRGAPGVDDGRIELGRASHDSVCSAIGRGRRPENRAGRLLCFEPMSLLACPFCRELFQKGERAKCPVCGVDLVALEKLPPSDDARNEDGTPREPDSEPLPAAYLGRGRGLLTLLALAGLVAFFLPWVEITLPDVMSLSGFALARRLGWAWGAGVAWFILVPTVLSRRSIRQMRGARVAAAFLSAVPGTTVAVLLARPPHGVHHVPLRFSFSPALYATLALSLVAVGVAAFLGGRADDIRVRRGSSEGQLVH
jgi:hypothetical protein